MSMTEILDELPKLKVEERHLLFQRLRELDGNPPPITVGEFFERFKPGSHLSPEEAEAFERDIEEYRKLFNKPHVSQWD